MHGIPSHTVCGHKEDKSCLQLAFKAKKQLYFQSCGWRACTSHTSHTWSSAHAHGTAAHISEYNWVAWARLAQAHPLLQPAHLSWNTRMFSCTHRRMRVMRGSGHWPGRMSRMPCATAHHTNTCKSRPLLCATPCCMTPPPAHARPAWRKRSNPTALVSVAEQGCTLMPPPERPKHLQSGASRAPPKAKSGKSHSASHSATVPQCHSVRLRATVPQCHRATVPQCHNATEPQCHSATEPQCHNATVPQSHSATVPQCQPQCHSVRLRASRSAGQSATQAHAGRMSEQDIPSPIWQLAPPAGGFSCSTSCAVGKHGTIVRTGRRLWATWVQAEPGRGAPADLEHLGHIPEVESVVALCRGGQQLVGDTQVHLNGGAHHGLEHAALDVCDQAA